MTSDFATFSQDKSSFAISRSRLNSAVALFELLIEFVQSLHTRFEEFEAEGKKLSECDQYAEEGKRVRKLNRCYEEPGSAPELLQTSDDKFPTCTFLVIIDSLGAELQKRLSAYAIIAEDLVLQKLADLTNEEEIKSAKSLQEAFPSDLEASLSDELLQRSSFLNTELAKKVFDITAHSHSSTPFVSLDETNEGSDTEDDTKFNVEWLELRIYRLLVSNNLETVFSNTVIAFRIYLSMMVSNCSGERSFSKLKLLKSHLRSCMTQERLNSLALLNIETNVLRSIDMSSLINGFALKKSRKRNIYRESTE